MSTSQEIEIRFRQEYGNIVSLLAGRVGIDRLSDIEDAVQSALLSALRSWPEHGEPANPTAWLYAVARNQLLESLRTQTRRRKILEDCPHPVQAPDYENIPEHFLPEEIPDDLLRVLFLTCDESIPEESQLALALKVLCGFGVKEIAHALFSTEANIYKRLSRAKTRLQQISLIEQDLVPEQYAARLPTILKIIYLLFNEGYHSTESKSSIRNELCLESLRLASLVANSHLTKSPESAALYALLLLHSSRLTSRVDPHGGLILLEEQDRSAWDHTKIQEGLYWLARSSTGDNFSRYHAEAGIAAEHSLAPSYSETRWDRIIACYDALIDVSPSPLHILNRAVAIAESQGPDAALATLEDLAPPSWLSGSHLWSAVMADLYLRSNFPNQASRYRKHALATAPTPEIKTALQRRFAQTMKKGDQSNISTNSPST